MAKKADQLSWAIPAVSIDVMIGLLFTVLTGFLVTCCVLHSAPPVDAILQSDLERWNIEINQSISRNIHGSCRISNAATFDEWNRASSTDVVIARIYPSNAEVDALRNIPLSLTKANNRTLNNENTELYEWAKETELMWMHPSDHPVQNRSNCVSTLLSVINREDLPIYESFKTIERAFYIMRSFRALVSDAGAVLLKCGFLQGAEGCENRFTDSVRNWATQCAKHVESTGKSFWSAIQDKAMMTHCINRKIMPKRHKRVFVIDASHDFNFHHVIADSIARLIHHLPFLRANPDIKIHIRAWEDLVISENHSHSEFRLQDAINAVLSRNTLFEMLGLNSSRIVSGFVLAEEVLFPRAMRCSFSLSNPVEIRMVARELIKGSKSIVKANMRHDSVSSSAAAIVPSSSSSALSVARQFLQRHEEEHHLVNKRRNLVILQRDNDKKAWGHRQWSNTTISSLIDAFSVYFPNHNIIVHKSSAILKSDFCMACEIYEMTHADILVGTHGAGLTKEIFMPQGAMLMEIVGRMSDVSFPYCGYYSNVGAIFGHHAYIFAYNNRNWDMEGLMNATEVAVEAAKFYRTIQIRKRAVTASQRVY
jgi:hypothetical protein